MKYSIIYALIRPEISEKISLGLIIVTEDEIKVRYSEKKLQVLKLLYTTDEYNFIAKVVRSMNSNDSIKSIAAINYLSRYFNNLLSISKLKSIDLKQDKQNEEWLFRSYVYDRTTK